MHEADTAEAIVAADTVSEKASGCAVPAVYRKGEVETARDIATGVAKLALDYPNTIHHIFGSPKISRIETVFRSLSTKAEITIFTP